MKRQFMIIIPILAITLVLASCANNAAAPCPNYGAWCSKTPINSWNTNA